MRSLRYLALFAALSSFTMGAPTAAFAEEGEHAAAHEGGAGHEEEGPVIENWFSWDYGPGKTHKHPPFAFSIINFGIYLFIMYRLAGGSFTEFMRTRHQSVRRALDEAAEIQKKAQAELDKYQERIKRIDGEVDELLRTVRKEAEAERARIVAAAEAQAEQLRKDAEVQVKVEIERARAELQRAAAKAAVDAAEAILKSQMQDGDQKRLVDEYIGRMESLGQAPQKVASAAGSPNSGRWQS